MEHDCIASEDRDSSEALVSRIGAACAPWGLDLVKPFRLDWYNRAVDPEYGLPDLGRSGTLGVLIANTRAMWPCFIEALRREPHRLESEHPLDGWVTERVLAAAAGLPVRWSVHFAHERPPRRVAMQRLAHLSGLARLSETHLNIHPIYGPWIGLRAAVVIDAEGPPDPPPEPYAPCEGCEARCIPLFRRAMACSEQTIPIPAEVRATWQDWVAVREACSVGQQHRYGDDQIRYHYTKNREVLVRLVSER